MEEQPIREKRKGRFRRLKIEKGSLKRRARKLENATVKHAHRFLTRRWTNVRDAGRHTIGWLVAVGLLIALSGAQLLWYSNAYTTNEPADGGTYAEGMVSQLETMNPLFASNFAEQSATRLIFSSLLDYDRDNYLRPSVASDWTVSSDGKVYTINLRKDVRWHDGKSLSADDVLFTVRLIQDESVRAEQYASWAGVKAEKVTDSQIKFTLPNVYAPFSQSLTFGILPKHILEKVKPSDLRENSFGRNPVGTGPFKFERLQLIDPEHNRLVVHMQASETYFRGAPRLNRFQLHTYETRDVLAKALATNEVSAALGLGADQINNATKQAQFEAASNKLSDGMFALYNNDSPIMKDVAVRQALVMATDRRTLLNKVYDRGVALEGPLPASFVASTTSKQLAFDKKAAEAKLEAAGWKLASGTRMKDGKPLEIQLVAPKTGDYKLILDELSAQWRAVGVLVKTQLVETDTIVSDYLQGRNYDVLVYELAIGADADVNSYWHSSQAKASGLNLANYRSGLADDALSSARARLEPVLRAAKYKNFYEQWLKDTPAIALYQPLLSYVSGTNTYSLDSNELVADIASRFRSVERWSATNRPVLTTP